MPEFGFFGFPSPTLVASANRYVAAVLADAPLRYYIGSDAPGSTTAADSSTVGQTGTWNGSPLLGVASLLPNLAQRQLAAQFTGAAQSLSASATGLPTANGARTLEAWVFVPGNAAPASQLYVFGYGQNAAVNSCQLAITAAGVFVTDYTGGSVSSTFTIPSSFWAAPIALAFVNVGNGFGRWFVNGAFVGQVSGLGFTTNLGGGVVAGRDIALSAASQSGVRVQHMAIYATALSDAQIAAHYQAGSVA